MNFSSQIGQKQLSKFSLDVGDRIALVIERIKIRPFMFVKRLVGPKYFRLRIGDYRLIFDIQQGKLIILVIEIGHLRNVCKDD